jgi:Zn-finger nucleic acid-binding protein
MSQTFKCPKCPGYMRTYNRSGVHIEQCDNCRGIFLDYGEAEALSRAEAQWNQPAPPPPGYSAPPPPAQGYPAQGYPAQPAWGSHGHGGYHPHRKHSSFGRMLFSS